MGPEAIKLVATNKKVRHDFHILDTFEAGLVLTGSEVKSLCTSAVVLKEGFVLLKGNEAFIVGMQIPPYPFANRQNHNPFRKRKLLLNRHEILKLQTKIRERGYTVLPLQLYFKRGRAKLEIAVVQHKKQYDKREDMKKADARRELDRARKQRR